MLHSISQMRVRHGTASTSKELIQRLSIIKENYDGSATENCYVLVDKFIIEVEAQLEDRGVSLSINEEAKEYLSNKGYDEIYGARELGRVIQEEVKKPMAEELIFGSLVKGGHVEIYIKDKKIAFNFLNKKETKKELV